VKNREMLRRVQRLDDLIQRTAEATDGDLELQAHWAKYLCVLCAGMLEVAVPELYGAYVKRRASSEVGAFAASALSSVRNPKPVKFLELSARFDTAWKVDLEKFFSEDGRGDAIESIMNHRHLIAHGKDSNITMSALKTYYSKAIKVLEFIEGQCAA